MTHIVFRTTLRFQSRNLGIIRLTNFSIIGIRLAELSTLPRDVIQQAKTLANLISTKRGASRCFNSNYTFLKGVITPFLKVSSIRHFSEVEIENKIIFITIIRNSMKWIRRWERKELSSSSQRDWFNCLVIPDSARLTWSPTWKA